MKTDPEAKGHTFHSYKKKWFRDLEEEASFFVD